MPTKLKNLCIKTIGSVTKPANQAATVALMKRAEENLDEPAGLFSTLLSKLGISVSDFSVSKIQKILEVTEPILKGQEVRKEDYTMPLSEEVMKGLAQEVQDYIKGLEGQVTELQKSLTEAQPNVDDDVWKGVNPAVRKMVEDAQAQLAKTQADLIKAQEDQLRSTFVAKAAAYAFLPLEVNKLGDILFSVSKGIPEEEYINFEGLLKAANEAFEQAKLFQEAGSGNTGNLEKGANVMDQVEKLAAAKMAIDTTLTKEQAIVKVFSEKPELYQQYCEAME